MTARSGRLQGRRALITGSSSGIGRGIALAFAAEGADVVVNYPDASQAANAAEVVAAVVALGRRAIAIQADVALEADVDRLVDSAVQYLGGLDILVNNAGITHAAEFLDLDETDFDRVLAVNLKSMFLCGQAAARRMVAQGNGGAIVNMSSANAVVAIANQVPYVVSKGGINQLTKVMAISLAAHGIRVNGIGPGTIATELAKQAVLGSEDAKRKILSRTPMGRLGEPSEVAAIAAFLASDDASYLTGQTIYPDGGRLALNYTVPVA